MGRPNKGWRLKRTPGSSTWSVVWTDPPIPPSTKGIERQFSTGERVRRKASVVAARIYSAELRGEKHERSRATRLAADNIVEKGGQWLKARTDLDERDTKRTYALYFRTHLEPFFTTLRNVQPDTVRAYCEKRLRCVSNSTVRHELSALRQLVAWVTDETTALLLVPKLSKAARGTPYEKSTGKRRRGAPSELSEAETIAIISALPEWSRTPKNRPESERYPIRARFIVKYETGLREALLDQLSIPEHWDPKNPSELRITPELDKMRYARVVVLTQVAQTALLSLLASYETITGTSYRGTLFGSHDYRCAIRAAAAACSLLEHRVRVLTPNDLRHARATHLGAKPEANLNAMMFMFGWTQPSTAARYMHPDKEAMREMLAIGPTHHLISSAQTVSEPSTTPTSSPMTSEAALANRSGASTSGVSSGQTERSTTSMGAAASLGGSSTYIGKPSSDDEPPFGFG